MPWTLKTIVALVILLIVSAGLNLSQFLKIGRLNAECDKRILALQADALQATIDRDTDSVSIGRETTEAAEEVQGGISQTTNERAERVRTITRTITVPADCPVSLPDGVQAELGEAARAANRRL